MSRAEKPGEAMRGDAGDFLARWSQRKLESRRQDTESVETGEDLSRHMAEPDTVTEPAPSEREPTDADMPPLESLTADSDFTPFMSPGVSDGLRRLALRKLFSKPDFNITDGLNDYDEDYTQFTGLGNVITHEMKRMLQREQEAAAEDVLPAAEPQDADASPPEEELPPEMAAGQTGSTDAAEDDAVASDEDEAREDKTP